MITKPAEGGGKARLQKASQGRSKPLEKLLRCENVHRSDVDEAAENSTEPCYFLFQLCSQFHPTLLTISTIITQNIMKLTLIATAFAALLSTGYATETNDRNLDAVPTAGVESPAMETHGMEPVLDEEGKRTLGAEDDAAAAKAPKMTNEEGNAGGKRRALGNKKHYSGQSCSLCCDDDYHC
jgi:hypothetical protein